MNKAKKIIIIVLSCVVVLGGIYFALRTLKQKNQNSKTVGVYAVSEIGYDASSMWDNSTLSGNVTANSEQKVYVGKTQAVSEIKVKEGQTVKAENGRVYTPDMVLGAPRKGIKVTYCTDTRPTESIVKSAEHADLFICEGMYAEKDKLAKARQYKHMTFYEAADMAKRADVAEMWLTHFSPSLVHAEDYMPDVKKIFENSYLGKDGKSVELLFDENE